MSPQVIICVFLLYSSNVENLLQYFSYCLQVKAVYRDLCSVQLSRALGQHEKLTPQEHIQLADSLVSRYSQTLDLTSHMADTDIRFVHANEMALLHRFTVWYRSCFGAIPLYEEEPLLSTFCQ